jgi:hypothetical protein
MAGRVTVFWHGKEYDAVRAPGRQSGQVAPTWEVRSDGVPVANFTEEPGEGAVGVKEKIIGWLQANESRPTSDVGRQ